MKPRKVSGEEVAAIPREELGDLLGLKRHLESLGLGFRLSGLGFRVYRVVVAPWVSKAALKPPALDPKPLTPAPCKP